VPFPTRLFTEHLADGLYLETAGRVYTVSLALPPMAWIAKWLYAMKTRAFDPRLDDAYLRELTRGYLIASGLMVAAVVLSFVDWRLGLGLAGAVTLYHLRAPPWPVYEEPQTAHAHPHPDAEQT
jgi:uncharacterized membrane protein (DUF485 family)